MASVIILLQNAPSPGRTISISRLKQEDFTSASRHVHAALLPFLRLVTITRRSCGPRPDLSNLLFFLPDDKRFALASERIRARTRISDAYRCRRTNASTPRCERFRTIID